jgi:hypothetical protein
MPCPESVLRVRRDLLSIVLAWVGWGWDVMTPIQSGGSARRGSVGEVVALGGRAAPGGRAALISNRNTTELENRATIFRIINLRISNRNKTAFSHGVCFASRRPDHSPQVQLPVSGLEFLGARP